ncbi:Thioredoxin domain-containing protein 15-like protein [Aphelenchoides besseyi]|nr:Thioredoxin domain-containing protein 15-like protein [Aphelenchoides besseyi]
MDQSKSLFWVVCFALFCLISSGTSTATDEVCFSLPFEAIARFQCPMINDSRCVHGMTKSRNAPHIWHCGLIEARNTTNVMIVDGNMLIEQLKELDPFGRPMCSVVFFYSPNCVFSTRVAGYVYSVAQLFPKLRVFALNVDNKSTSDQLINQHGIAATPVLFLFENQVARLRLHDDMNSFQSLVELLLKRTDLALPPGIKRQDLNTIGNTSESSTEHFVEYREFILNFFEFADMSDGVDRYYVLANIILLINIIYFLYVSPRISQWFPRNQR